MISTGLGFGWFVLVGRFVFCDLQLSLCRFPPLEKGLLQFVCSNMSILSAMQAEGKTGVSSMEKGILVGGDWSGVVSVSMGREGVLSRPMVRHGASSQILLGRTW